MNYIYSLGRIVCCNPESRLSIFLRLSTLNVESLTVLIDEEQVRRQAHDQTATISVAKKPLKAISRLFFAF